MLRVIPGEPHEHWDQTRQFAHQNAVRRWSSFEARTRRWSLLSIQPRAAKRGADNGNVSNATIKLAASLSLVTGKHHLKDHVAHRHEGAAGAGRCNVLQGDRFHEQQGSHSANSPGADYSGAETASKS